jgi:hypothetical protein
MSAMSFFTVFILFSPKFVCLGLACHLDKTAAPSSRHLH